jgi:DNA-binding LacI/PurR family transcriptional regulator
MGFSGHNVAVGRVTLQTIADRVGVSRMTVSNAFSRPDQLSVDLRDRILEVASELGYAGPDPAARGLARGSAGTVGILLTESLTWAFEDEIAARFVGAIASELDPTGKALTLLTSSDDDGDFVPARDVALDGAVAYLCDDSSPALGWLLKRQLPLVFVDHTPRPGYDSVNIDDRKGAQMAAKHLVDLGHRRIGIISSSKDRPTGWVQDPVATQSSTIRERLEGWTDVLAAAGVEARVVEANIFEKGASKRAAELLLEDNPSTTGILCFSDAIAYGAVTAVRERGLKVPDDVSIVGFDGSQRAARMTPPLTTVRQDVVEKGRAAAHALVRRMEGSSARARRVRLPVELVIAGSTAPARS